MKKLIALILISTQAFAGLPPTTTKGQSDASARVKFQFQAPHNQFTNLGGIKTLIETGNGNILPDPGFEASVSGWTASGGATATTNSTAKGTGALGYDWDSNSASQTLTSTSVTIPNGYQGRNGVLSCSIKTVSGVATHTIGLWNGTTLSNTQTIVSSTTSFIETKINFVIPSSGTAAIRLTAISSNESEIYVDDCKLSLADNIGTVAQAVLVDSVTVTGCAGTWSTTSSTFASTGAQTGCVYTSAKGVATAPATNIPGFKFASLPAGDYRVEYEGRYGKATGGIGGAQFTDGTNTAREISSIDVSASAASPSISQTISYSSPQSNVTLELRLKSNDGNITFLDGRTATSGGVTPGTFRLWYFPSTSQQVYNPSLQSWRVDANINGANPSLGTANVASYTGIENASLTLTNNTGNGVIAAQIPCSSTNSPTGTTCSVGNESVGVSFNLPVAGDVLACASFAHISNVAANSGNSATFQIVETPNNAQTISQEGKSRVNDATSIGAVALDSTFPHRLCGTFTFASAGQKTLRLMYEQLVQATVTSSVITGDASVTQGQRDIHWEVTPLNQLIPAPIVIGSVTSNSTQAIRHESTRLTCGNSGSALIANTGTSPNWTVANGVSAGLCTVTVSFAQEPSCHCDIIGAQSILANSCLFTSTPTTTTIAIARNRAAAAENGDIMLSCDGSR